jgi:hypothetical protein
MQSAIECTLLELVKHVNEVTEDENEVVATVVNLVNGGRVRLCGTFAGAKIKLPASLSLFPERLWPVLLGLRSPIRPHSNAAMSDIVSKSESSCTATGLA